ncbi:MAG: extracellular solute-binding protein [Brooklawnia sp.]
MRKLLTLGAALAVAGTLSLSACGGGGSGTTETTPSPTAATSAPASAGGISIWIDSNREPVLTPLAEQFEADTGVSVQLIVKDSSAIVDDFTTQAPSGQGPDAIITAHDNIGRMVQNGVIAPIELGGAAEDFQPVTVQAFTYEGQVYGVPYSIENLALIRNTELAPDAPATWDDAVAAGQAAGTSFPILVGGDDATTASAYNLYPFQQSFGAPVFELTADGSYDASQVAMGGEAGAAFAQWLDEQAKAGILRLSITNDIAITEFTAGNSPFIVTGPWNLDQVKAAGFDYSIDPIPSAGPEPAAPFVGAWGFAMSAYTQNELSVQRFLTEYVATEETQTALFEAGNRAPANKAAFEAASSDPDVAAFGAVGAAGVPMPNVPAMAGVWTDWGNALTEIVDQRTDDPAGTWQSMVDTLQGKIG